MHIQAKKRQDKCYDASKTLDRADSKSTQQRLQQNVAGILRLSFAARLKSSTQAAVKHHEILKIHFLRHLLTSRPASLWWRS